VLTLDGPAAQLAGHDMLKALDHSGIGSRLRPSLVRQVLGAIAQFEKASVVAKLAAAHGEPYRR
jgi:hypothetical protein